MDLEEMGINEGNWVDSTQDRNYWRAFVNAALNHRVLQAMELVYLQGRELQEGLDVKVWTDLV